MVNLAPDFNQDDTIDCEKTYYQTKNPSKTENPPNDCLSSCKKTIQMSLRKLFSYEEKSKTTQMV